MAIGASDAGCARARRAYAAAMAKDKARPQPSGLSITALYTAETWGWGGLPCADLLVSTEGRRVFNATNFALSIARLFIRDLRSLRHSLLHRHGMIDHLARASGARQILELAAGLSRRGVALSAEGSIRYTEIDLPPVVAHKRALLERSPEGRAALARENLRLVGGDVLALDLAEHVDASEPAFVIAEGLCMYLKPEDQRALFARVRSLLGGAGGTFVFDLVPTNEEPEPGRVGRALEWLMKRFTGGKSFERAVRTREDIAADLRAAGFEVEIREPAAVAAEWGLAFPEVPTRVVLFVAKA